MKAFIFFFVFLMIVVVFSLIFATRLNKRITNTHLAKGKVMGKGNATQDILLQNSYLTTGKKVISDNEAYNIWWHYPVFEVGSYAQITNNIKYPNNPDEGTCMPASMCQTLYKNKKSSSNYVYGLPPVNTNTNTSAVRVNYYNASLPK